MTDDYVAEPFQARFNYYDYGGQYNFIVRSFEKLLTFIRRIETDFFLSLF